MALCDSRIARHGVVGCRPFSGLVAPETAHVAGKEPGWLMRQAGNLVRSRPQWSFDATIGPEGGPTIVA
jgi:hypothetical protein